MTSHFEGNSFGRWCSAAAAVVLSAIPLLLLLSSFPQMPSFAHAYATFGSSSTPSSSYQLLPAPNYNPTPASDVVVQEQRDMEMIEKIVDKCYRGWCHDWMLECHWFCDSIRGLSNYQRCSECLSKRGLFCLECFSL